MIVFNKKYYREISLLIFLCLLSALLLYYFLLSTPLANYHAIQHEKQHIKNTLSHALKRQQHAIETEKQLNLIHEKENTLFMNAYTFKTIDPLSALLSRMMAQAGFSIDSIQSVSKDHTLHFQVTATGNYFALFRLIAALKIGPWPIYPAIIQIEKKAHYHFDFLAAPIT